MKYFLTGATGFVGGRLARMLREQGLRETFAYEMKNMKH
jgi:uncharacterized protein YbjT (DUF2867 family)